MAELNQRRAPSATARGSAAVASAPAEPPGGAPARHRAAPPGRRRRGPHAITISLFMLPGLALIGLLFLTPVFSAIYYSLFRWNGLGGWPPFSRTSEFVGIDNFVRALGSDLVQGDLWRGLVLLILSICIQLPISLGLALLLHQRFPGRTAFRLLFFAPYVISEVITGVIFTAVFRQDGGLLNETLRVVGLGALVPTNGWLGTADILLFVAFFVITWKYFGLHMIIYLAGRQNIPRELTDAAMTDGATSWQVFRHVTLPLLGPTIRVTIFLSVIGVIQLFDMIFVLTAPNLGGPGNAAETLAVTMYTQGFERFQIGYASAISVLMFVICLIFAMAYIRFVMRRDIQGAVTTAGGR